MKMLSQFSMYCILACNRLSSTRNILQPVMCGVLVLSCMRFGVSDASHLKTCKIPKLVVFFIVKFENNCL